jgi:hypothetical protein
LRILLVFAAVALSACTGTIEPVPADPATVQAESGSLGRAGRSLSVWDEDTQGAAFAGRDGPGALVLNGKAYLLGGWRGLGNDAANFAATGAPGCCTTSEVWSTTDGVRWQLETVAPWRPRHMAGWVSYAGKLWVIGGDNNLGFYESDVWSSPDGKTWTQVTDDVPWAPRILHYAVAFNGALWVIGGQQLYETLVPLPNPYPTEPVYYDDVWRSIDGANWERVGTVPHAIGEICGSVTFNSELWVIGGGQYGDAGLGLAGAAYNEVWSSKDGVNWQQHASAPWPARRYHNIIAYDGRLWVMAGVDGTDTMAYNDVWYSSDGDTWQRQTAAAPWSARHAAVVFVLNGTLYLTAGTTGGEELNDIWSLE